MTRLFGYRCAQCRARVIGFRRDRRHYHLCRAPITVQPITRKEVGSCTSR